MLGEARGVVDEVGDRALERVAADRHHQRALLDLDGDRPAAMRLALHLAQDLADVGAHDLLAGVALGERHVVLQHRLHLVDVGAHRFQLGRILEQGELQFEARQHRAQIVADAGQHDGALLDIALDAVAHLDEGMRRLAHLARAARLEIGRRRPPSAETVGRLRQPQDRFDLVAQEQNRHGQQHQRGADHPQQEDLRVRRVGLAAPGDHVHHRIVELDADIDEIGAADRVDPERLADLPRQLVGQRGVEQVEERLGAHRRQFLARREADAQAEILLGQPRQRLGIRLRRIGLIEVHQHADILHGDGRQPPRHRLPVTLEKHEGEHRLQQHHRRDDDDQRARIEALRHAVAERAEDAPERPDAFGQEGFGVGGRVHHSGYRM